jgi:hypothetical protein
MTLSEAKLGEKAIAPATSADPAVLLLVQKPALSLVYFHDGAVEPILNHHILATVSVSTPATPT